MIDLFEDKFFKKGSNGLELDKKVVSAAGNYYDILGVSEDASMEIIKMAIGKAILKYHPDKNHSKLEGETESEHEIRKEKANSIFIYLKDVTELVLTIAKQREIRRDTERDIDINRDSDKEIILQIFLKFFPNHTETDFKRLLRITTNHNKDIIFTIGNHESPIDQDKLPHKQVTEFVKFISWVSSREVLGKEDVRGFYQKIECSSKGSELSGSSIKFKVGPRNLLFKEDKRKIALRMLDWHKQADGFIEEFNRNPEFNLLEASLLFRKGSCEIMFRERIELKKLPFRSLGCQEYNINRQSQFLRVKREFGYVAGELKRQRPEHSAYTVYDNDTSSEDIRDAVSNAQNLEGVAYFAFVSINIDSALSTKSSVFLLGRLKAEILTKITENNFFLADQSRKPSIKEVFQMLLYFWGGGKSKGEEEQFIKRFLSENSNFANGFKELIEEFQEKIKTTLLVDDFGCQRFFNEFLKEQLFREIEKEQLFREIELTKSPKLEEGEAEWHYSFIEVYKRLILSLENSEKTYEEVQRKLIEGIIKIVHAYQFLDDLTAEAKMVVEEREKLLRKQALEEGSKQGQEKILRTEEAGRAPPTPSAQPRHATQVCGGSAILIITECGNRFRVLDGLYSKEGGKEQDMVEVEKVMLAIIKLTMTELKMTLEEARIAIKIAKFDADIINAKLFGRDIKLSDEKALEFSQIFERKCKDCGILTPDEASSVGLPLISLPKNVIKGLHLLEKEGVLDIDTTLVEAKTAAVKLLTSSREKSR